MSSQPNLNIIAHECPGDLLTPVAAYLKLQPLSARFLLESVEGGERSSRYSFLGLGARARIRADATGTFVEERGAGPRRLAAPQDDPLDAALAYISGFRIVGPQSARHCLGGLVGCIGYDYVRRLERIGTPPPGTALPEIVFELVDELLVFDHLKHRVHFMALAEAGRDSAVRERFAAVEQALNGPLPAAPATALQPRFRPLMADEAYCAAVATLQEHIRAGDIFQAVLSAEVEVENAPPMFEIYRALRRVNPSPYMFYMDFPELTLAGSSPESAVKLTGRRAALRPIAGTRKRGRDDVEDVGLEHELKTNVKELAEHAMLVDLARNDLSRVAAPGTVTVRDYAQIERFSHVMHLVSDVEGTLDASATPADLIRATFPAGTVSGAPKIRAMQLIDAHETTRRNYYAGCAGYIGADGTLDMALVIRTVFRAAGRTTIRAGAGIVAGSTPEGELQECRSKLAAQVAAIRDAAGEPA